MTVYKPKGMNFHSACLHDAKVRSHQNNLNKTVHFGAKTLHLFTPSWGISLTQSTTSNRPFDLVLRPTLKLRSQCAFYTQRGGPERMQSCFSRFSGFFSPGNYFRIPTVNLRAVIMKRYNFSHNNVTSPPPHRSHTSNIHQEMTRSLVQKICLLAMSYHHNKPLGKTDPGYPNHQ